MSCSFQLPIGRCKRECLRTQTALPLRAALIHVLPHRAYVEKQMRIQRDREEWNRRRRAVGQYENLVVRCCL